MIRVYAVQAPDAMEAVGPKALETRRLGRLQRIRNPQERGLAVAAEILARWAVAEERCLDPTDVHLERDANGKPFVPGVPEVHLNLSHAGEWAVCATGAAPLGIDVEQEIALEVDVVTRILSSEEARHLMQAPQDQRSRRFFELWTLKESYAKALGLGWRISPDSFTISCGLSNEVVVCGPNARPGYHWRRYRIARDYPVSVCAREDAFPPGIALATPGVLRDFVGAA